MIQVRDRSRVSSSSLRQLEFVPPGEIDKAITEAIARSVAISSEEVSRCVADALGFSATSAQLRAVVGERVHHLVSESSILAAEGLLRLRNSD